MSEDDVGERRAREREEIARMVARFMADDDAMAELLSLMMRYQHRVESTIAQLQGRPATDDEVFAVLNAIQAAASLGGKEN